MFNTMLSEMTFKWNPSSLFGADGSLLMTLKGMLGIFIVIVIIWVFVAVLNRVTKKKR